MKRFILKIALPWLITVVALYLAFRGIEWELLWSHVKEARLDYLFCAVCLTALSYLLRSGRWPLLFPSVHLRFIDSFRVLILGFFMNNALPARAGELVRAHLGGKVTGQKRTLVLATIASERLADGVTLSLMFALIILFFGKGHLDPEYAQNLLYVAYLFFGAGVAVMLVVCFREFLFKIFARIETRFNHKTSTYALSRAKLFVEGLAPLSSRRAPLIALWSVVIWSVELLVFYCVTLAFNSPLSLSATVLFLVAVNFSALIPAAPGGFGVIELVAKKVLLSVGVQSDELALSMVIAQHMIQYLLIGLTGGIIMATWRRPKMDEIEQED